MYLKRIEIYGFKSFGEKADIKLDNKVTGIVGPNGSGKSNVVDAIRWVLGEQRVKSLRGQKMEDVIFSGTNEKAPLGYASVTITLDNSDKLLNLDYNEISVSRKLYRSGESEYYINKSQVRLKDVQELFMDTGLGREGYSIIGQGRIESVVNNSPEERKLMIEEAAGIVKYKTKKIEAMRKLERVQANLLRIADITSEIASRLSTLKRQSEKAKIYLDLKEELKKLEVGIFSHEMDFYTKELEENKSINAQYEHTINELSMQAAKLDERYVSLKEIITTCDETVAKLQNEKDELFRNNENANSEIIVANTKIETYENQTLSLEKEKEELLLSIEELSKSISPLQEELSGLKETTNSKMEVFSLQKKTVEALDEVLKKESDAFAKKSDELSIAKNKYAALSEQLSSAKSNASTMKLLNERLDDENTELNKSLSKLEDDDRVKVSIKAKDDYEKASFALKTKDDELVKLKKEYDAVCEQERSILEKSRILQSKVDFLSDYENSGYRFGVRKLLETTQQSESVFGAVGDVIATDAKYTQAIQKSLGAMIEYVICSNEDTAAKMIDILKKNKWGRVTFLPKSAVKGKKMELGSNEKNLNGYLCVASEVVGTKPEFAGIVENLLGKTVIIDTMENAISFTKATQNRYKVVTLDGEVFFPGGAMVGGKNKNDEDNILSRKAQAEKMTKDLELLQKECDSLYVKKQSQKAKLSSFEENIAILREETEEKKIHFIQCQRDAGHFASQAEELSLRIQANEKEIEKTKKDIEENVAAASSLSSKIDALAKEIASLEENVKDINIGINKDEYIKQSSILSAYQMEYVKADEAFRSKTQSLCEIQEKLSSIRSQKEIKEQTISSLKEECGNLRQKIERLTLANADFAASRDTLSQKIALAMSQKEALTKEFMSINDDIMKITTEKNQVSEKQTEVIRKIESTTLSMEYLQRDMLEEYDMTYILAKDSQIPVEDIGSSRLRVKELKEKVKSLGHVNVDALEEYKEQNERHQQLCLQQEDLQKSKDELNRIIKDMNKKMQVKFLEQFNLIQVEFDKIFKRLFGGGEARLILTDEDDLLETGVDIVACPPKAKLKNISSLSGGEKSMTAIALIFAIFSIKPAIFAILDEIDAALDDANLNRLCEYIHMIKDENQFIIITHRKPTMEVADTVYGVTMNLSGVTKVVSVKLSEVSVSEA